MPLSRGGAQDWRSQVDVPTVRLRPGRREAVIRDGPADSLKNVTTQSEG
jgi:hypothetical protein